MYVVTVCDLPWITPGTLHTCKPSKVFCPFPLTSPCGLYRVEPSEPTMKAWGHVPISTDVR